MLLNTLIFCKKISYEISKYVIGDNNTEKELFMKKGFIFPVMLICLMAFILALVGCAPSSTLSEKVQQQNIKVETSEQMVIGMSLVHAYSISSSALNITEWVNPTLERATVAAANKAAEDGYSNITVLVKTGTAPGSFQQGIWDVSYWQ